MSRLFALLVLLIASTAAWADGGLDLAVLVDRSTSAARHARDGRLVLRMMAELMARNADANRVEHRMAVIGFGSSATVEMPFTAVGTRDLPRLRRRIDALPDDDRGDTDVLAALVAAHGLFRALPPSPGRRRAIVLMTDGVPYVRGADMNAYRASLRRFAAAQLTGAGVTIDVLLVDSRNRALWTELARVELAAGAPEQLLAHAHGVIARLVGTQTAESAPAKTNPAVDTLVVPPYLEVIVFDIFRPSAGGDVDVFPPGSATPIRAGAGGIESARLGDVLMTLVVPRPPPGEWIIRKSRGDARVRVLSQQFFPRGALLRPGETETLRRCDAVSLAYRVLDGNGRSFVELRDYALAVEVTLAKPGGGSAVLPMERDAALGAGVFRSAQDFLCAFPGRYWTDVRITTVDAGGHRLDVFRDRWSGFSVAPAPAGDCKARAANEKMRADVSPRSLPAAAWLLLPLAIGASVSAAWVRRRKTKI